MKRALIVCTLIAAVGVPAAAAVDRAQADRNRGKDCSARESKRVESGVARSMPNGNKGHCASPRARAEIRKHAAACKKLRVENATTFAQAFKSLGRCVNLKKAEARATVACKQQRSDDALTFAETYKSLGQCVKAETAKARARQACKKPKHAAAAQRTLQRRDRCVKGEKTT